MKGLLFAFRFLTVVPLPGGEREIDGRLIGRSSSYFPVVGAVQGIVIYFLYLLLIRYFALDIVAGMLIAFHVIASGGFHVDGLSDTADAIASRAERPRMLEIMKDGSAGPAGVITVVLVVLIKYLALKNTLMLDVHSGLPLVLFPVMGRWSAVLAMYQGKGAAGSGLGRTFIDNTRFRDMALSSVFVLVTVLVIMMIIYNASHDMEQVSLFIVPLTVVWFTSILFVLYFRKKFGGMTGDCLGAVIEMTELVFLLTLLAVYTG